MVARWARRHVRSLTGPAERCRGADEHRSASWLKLPIIQDIYAWGPVARPMRNVANRRPVQTAERPERERPHDPDRGRAGRVRGAAVRAPRAGLIPGAPR